MEEKRNKLKIAVPATSANLGSGFDVLGLALDLHNIFTLMPAEETRLEITGHSEGVPDDDSNLFYNAFKHLYRLAGQMAPGLSVKMELSVPPGKGLGSSATAVVGGLVAANEFLDSPLDPDDLLVEAVKLEPGEHADNVAPALMGGLVVNAMDGDKVLSLRVPFPGELKAVLFTPDFSMDTVQGRALLPAQYSKADVVFSTSRVALFVSALQQRRFDLLAVAMQDQMHQPYRAQMFPLLPGLIEAALQAGAHGACLSGGGSSVLALATMGMDEIGAIMMRRAAAEGIKGEIRIFDIDQKGAEATWIEDRA